MENHNLVICDFLLAQNSSLASMNQEVSESEVEEESIAPDEPVELSHKTPTSDEV